MLARAGEATEAPVQEVFADRPRWRHRVALNETREDVAEMLRVWEGDAGEPPPDPTVLTCRCPAPLTRTCLQCGVRSCEACQPEAGGGPCVRCSGPVWAEGEVRTPARRHPQFKGW